MKCFCLFFVAFTAFCSPLKAQSMNGLVLGLAWNYWDKGGESGFIAYVSRDGGPVEDYFVFSTWFYPTFYLENPGHHVDIAVATIGCPEDPQRESELTFMCVTDRVLALLCSSKFCQGVSLENIVRRRINAKLSEAEPGIDRDFFLGGVPRVHWPPAGIPVEVLRRKISRDPKPDEAVKPAIKQDAVPTIRRRFERRPPTLPIT